MDIYSAEVKVTSVLDAILSYHQAQVKDLISTKDDGAFYKAEAAREITACIIGYADNNIQDSLKRALSQKIDAVCAAQFFTEE